MPVAAANPLKVITWPTPAADLTDSLGLDEMLRSLQFLADDTDRKDAAKMTAWGDDTPASMQVIRSGVLSLTKTAVRRVSAIGGAAGAVAAVVGLISPFVDKLGQPLAVVLIASAALILSSVAIALGLFVSADLGARGAATAARYEARAAVASAVLSSTADMPRKPGGAGGPPAERTLVEDFIDALRAYGSAVRVTTASKTTPVPVRNVLRRAGESELRLEIGVKTTEDEISLAEITGFTTKP